MGRIEARTMIVLWERASERDELLEPVGAAWNRGVRREQDMIVCIVKIA
jgi:hypothetical protein